MSGTSLMFFQDKMGKTQPQILTFIWEITGAKAVTPKPQGAPTLYSFDAITQASIDAFLTTPYLASSSEFTAAQFDATSMGTDAFGAIIDMSGQCDSALYIDAMVNVATGTAGIIHNTNALPGLVDSTLAADVEFDVSTPGNLAFKLLASGLDAATAGSIIIQIGWLAK